MDERLKQRLVGAAVLASLAVLFVPIILEPDNGLSEESMPSVVPRPPVATFTAPPPSLRAPVPPAEPMEASSTAGPELEESPAPSPDESSPRPRGPRAWTVQLGSFARHDNAVALQDRLEEKGFDVFVERVETSRGSFSRVLAEPELLRANAEKLQRRLKEEMELEGRVLRYPPG